MSSISVKSIIASAKRVVVLTGAGVSTESGIPDFRSQGGFWEKDHLRTYYMSQSFYNRKPKIFWQYYKDIFQLKLFGNFEPNEGHKFLANLERQGKDVSIFTQNVDGLHQKAGNSKVFEVHGSLITATCPKCKRQYDLSFIQEHSIPRCLKDNFILKPDVVLFGDSIHYYHEALWALESTDLFLTMGTSLQVSPINEVPFYAKKYRVPSVMVNKEPTESDNLFEWVFHQGIRDFVRQFDDVSAIE